MKRASSILVLLAIFFFMAAPAAHAETYITKTFPISTAVIPMDDQQGDRFGAFGLVHALLSNGVTVYRIVAIPDPMLAANGAAARSFFGGPFLIEGVIPVAIASEFPSVAVKHLDAEATSDRVFVSTAATNILVVYGEWAETGSVFEKMNIPFTQVTRADVEATIETDPEFMMDFDVVVVDCPAWFGNGASDELKRSLRNFVGNGGELIFNDVGLQTLNAVFPGYVNVTTNFDGTYDFSFHQQGEFLSQFYSEGGGPVAVYTHSGGNIVDAVLDPSVKILLDATDYGVLPGYWPGRPAVGAFYFPFGKGYVEGFAYHPQDQLSLNEQLHTVFYMNKLIHIVPPQPQPGRMTGGGTICQTTASTASFKGLNCGGSTSCKKEATHGFTLHCDVKNLPNSLEINWSNGKKFHLTELTNTYCSDDPAIVPRPPRVGFDTIEGTGKGRYNGKAGATVSFKFTDAGEPGTKDYAKITVTDVNGNVVLDIAGNLKKGNQQAHSN
jgi:hypothetical protein